jgi:hypothetical protein
MSSFVVTANAILVVSIQGVYELGLYVKFTKKVIVFQRIDEIFQNLG